MKIRPLVVLAIVALLLATGCATVTFKPGAGPGGAKADEDACRASSATQAAYVACLRERGWMVGGKDAAPAGKTNAAPAAQPTVIPAKPSTPPQPVPAGVPAQPEEMTPPDEGPGRAPSGQTAPVPPAPTKEPVHAIRAPRAGEPAPAEPAEEAPLDPNARINVSSWWKLGGTAAELDRAMTACAQELGTGHTPNAGGTEVTVAMKDCLRAKKWFAVGGTGPL